MTTLENVRGSLLSISDGRPWVCPKCGGGHAGGNESGHGGEESAEPSERVSKCLCYNLIWLNT